MEGVCRHAVDTSIRRSGLDGFTVRVRALTSRHADHIYSQLITRAEAAKVTEPAGGVAGTVRSGLEQLNFCAVARCPREAGVPGDQRCLECFRQHDICRIVGRERVAILPDARQERDLRISDYVKIAEYFDCFIGVRRRENSLSYESAQYLGDLDV